jgi:hypothetical protein
VFKKIFKAATVFSLLVGCYLGYVQVFAIVVSHMTTTRRTKSTVDSDIWIRHDSKSKEASIKLAKDVMPPGHWATQKDLNFRYYSGERGYWMYAQEMEQIQEENGVRYDGKRIRLKPFLVISRSRDGKKIQTITSDRAIIDMNQALGFSSGPDGAPLKVNHIRLEPNVVICDNKGTPNDPKDDMRIDHLTTLEYDEPTQQITTESHVVITDAEMITSGDGMLVQLGKTETSEPGGSTGADGVEYLELFRNVHVILRDAGKSGIVPGKSEPRRSANGAVGVKLEVAGGPEPTAQALVEAQPTPLDLTCDSKMRVHPAKTRLPVMIGPPAPPLPTIVQFERNVVVLRGKIDEQPGQLTCDNLKLTMLPQEAPPPRPANAQPGNPQTATTASVPKSETPPNPGETASAPAALAQADVSRGEGAESSKDAASPEKPAATEEKSGLFGGLALKRAHATGHAVWLYLPVEGIKLRCNELIHTRQMPEKPDLTYFRGDLTRELDIEKIDLVQDLGSPDHGKVKSITHIRTTDATMYDKGFGFDSADIDANGPGRLDTQPDRGQPIERTAIWQDKLKIRNDVDSEGKIKQKIILLTGNRPVFIDGLRGSRIDSAESIKVLLLPKEILASKDSPAPKKAQTPDGSSTDGGGFDIKRLLAFRDVHLLATGKTMTARDYLDAYFTHQPPPPAVASAPPAKNESVTDQPATSPTPVENEVAANDEEAKKQSSEPAMVGSADRMWVEIEMTPKAPTPKAAGKTPEETRTVSTTTSKPTSSESGLGDDGQSEIRKAFLWGSVAIHQDPAEGKTKGQEASGEALYLYNPAKNKAITFVFQREPNEKTPRPGPLPPARVENDEKTITATGGDGVIVMNQATDQAWVEGPGTLTQRSTRAADPPPADPPADPSTPSLKTANAPLTRHNTAAPASDEPLATSLLAQTNPPVDKPEQAAEPKPKTRAGRPLSEKVLSRIHFSEGMEFHGNSIYEGNPAGRADFFGVSTALLEDSLLRGEEGMIAYTDRPVPFAQLGALSKPKSKDADPAGAANGDDKAADEGPQLAVIECYRNAIAISRKVDPDRPEILQQQRIEASELLVYDRRTGNFHVPGKGKVYLYDRSDNSKAQGMSPGRGTPAAQPVATARTVTTASSRSSTGTTRSTAPPSARSRPATQTKPAEAPADPDTTKLPPLVLTQIHFLKGMRGRFGSTDERDPTEIQWYEFFGGVELARAKTTSPQVKFNFDKLPTDHMFLTSQTLRVRTEPPPVGSPPSTPARDYLKAWEDAKVHNSEKILDADVVTYDSEKDLIYAYGESGRGVNYAEQIANGQPSSQGWAKAMQLNPKTGKSHFIENASIQMIDKNSGARPQAAAPVDPDFIKKKRPKKGFRIPSSNIERRGFTGQ